MDRKNERREQNINNSYFWLMEISGCLFIILFFTYCFFPQIFLNKCVAFIIRELLKYFSIRKLGYNYFALFFQTEESNFLIL